MIPLARHLRRLRLRPRRPVLQRPGQLQRYPPGVSRRPRRTSTRLSLSRATTSVAATDRSSTAGSTNRPEPDSRVMCVSRRSSYRISNAVRARTCSKWAKGLASVLSAATDHADRPPKKKGRSLKGPPRTNFNVPRGLELPGERDVHLASELVVCGVRVRSTAGGDF